MEDANIEKTLNSLDGINRPVASDHLVERIMKGIEKAEATVVEMSPFQRWSIAAGIFLLITLNVLTATRYSSPGKKAESAFVQEYFSYMNNQY